MDPGCKKRSGRLAIFLWVLPIALAACASAQVAPIGGNGFQPEEDEKRIWREARDTQLRFDHSGLLYDDFAVTAYVNRVASRIIPEKISKEIRFDEEKGVGSLFLTGWGWMR
jgi:hypothetical protein